ncbi:hypothetical protein OROGR_020742 [Orobanche gracilis]
MLRVGSYYWLAWATPVSKKEAASTVNGSTLISVYAFLAFGLSVCSLAVDLLVVTAACTTATTLFRKFMQCIFRAPMSFFDATPSGRILSRCSTDQTAMEARVPSLVEGVASSVIQILGIVTVMPTVAWPVLIIFIPVVYLCIWYQRYYMTTARELSRLSGISEAPVTQHFVETISGCTTIRSFDKQTGFRIAYMKILDTYSRPDFYSAAAMKWLLFRQDALACCITFAFLLLLLVSFGENINPAIAGLAVSYGLTLSNALAGMVWSLCHCGTKMISVERILQYTSIPSEPPLIIEANRPHSSWPSLGEFCITNLQYDMHGGRFEPGIRLWVRYAPHLPFVLHGITCTFPGRKQTSIVGRTGSGKSTLIQALLRIVEPTSGRIMIDGIDISKIGLQDLRSRLEYTDEQLDSNVIENRGNWSMGQRQLICLGRVLLKKCKVLLLDEATASVDVVTDRLIQERLKEIFSSICTIITIAHRMTSVLSNSDMVLLLNNGRIEEFDYPTRLLESKSSAFAKLVAAWSNLRHSGTGKSSFAKKRRAKRLAFIKDGLSKESMDHDIHQILDAHPKAAENGRIRVTSAPHFPTVRTSSIGGSTGLMLQAQSVHDNLMYMVNNSDAFIVLPGGYDTLNEIFNITSWAERDFHTKPIGLLNINNFFSDLLAFLDKGVDHKFISQPSRDILICADTVADLLIKFQAYILVKNLEVKPHQPHAIGAKRKRSLDPLDLSL